MSDEAVQQWWRDAVVYEVYPRSFADGDDDGVGDLAGLRLRLPYLRDLGVDALWLTPWYPSPMEDGGYDVRDYRDVDPRLGTLADADAVIAEAHDLGLRVIVDIVPNHTSREHPWFVEALAAPDGHPSRDRYYFRDGRGPDGSEPPNDWISAFGGSAWERTTRADGSPGQWYLHIFAPGQPDLDWRNPDVVEEFDDILRFWFDRGVDGLRVDAVPALGKAPGLPDAGHEPGARFETRSWTDSPYWDREEVHEVLRHWRRVADSYGDRVLVAEAVVAGPDALAAYVREDEVHASFNFDFLTCPWRAGALRDVVDSTLASHGSVGAAATWVLSSHDEVRHLTRLGLRAEQTRGTGAQAGLRPDDVDLGLGTRRARAAALLLLGLPGSAYLWQGEELGLPEVIDLPPEVREDPVFRQSGGTELGRDGCRVPLPWSGDEPPFGFSAPGVATWLPQPEAWAALTAERQSVEQGSVLRLYRDALRLRREHRDVRAGAFEWLDLGEAAVAFRLGGRFSCVVNLGADAVPLDGHGDLLLHSRHGGSGAVEQDEAAWLLLP
ncbi:glycoside hydrolase family 13 protein [Aquipuribacter nitratireducens]|uniref:Glycoside hydrolase family 13 protein n=1 Tax=Aquipuribacter nitratireducens TaxID=650104 RepID=A0ABW0GNS2_9MICO